MCVLPELRRIRGCWRPRSGSSGAHFSGDDQMVTSRCLADRAIFGLPAGTGDLVDACAELGKSRVALQ